VKLPAENPIGTIWTQLHNAGDLNAVDVAVVAKGHIASVEMTLDQASAELDAMEGGLDGIPASKKSVLSRTQNAPITLEDFDSTRLDDYKSGKAKPSRLEFTDAQWDDFLHGKTLIYLFGVVTYRDEGLNKNEQWKPRFCGYFAQSTSFWHSCAKNAPEKIALK
jgi:hypothetical protein